MEDADCLSFDFEGGLDAGLAQPTASMPVVQSDSFAAAAAVNSSVPAGKSSDLAAAGGMGRGRSFRKTVCRHWLRSLCMKGEACGFLHQYDKSRMPVCRFFRLYGECREQDCVYKHTKEDIKECNMYKLGFCPNGPDCRYRHAKLPGPPPPVEEVLQKIQQLTSYNYGQNRFYQNRNVSSQQTERFQSQGPNTINQVAVGKSSAAEPGNLQQQQQPAQLSLQHSGQNHIQNSQTGAQNQANRISHPLPQEVTRYFVVKSCNRENLELSVQQGVWATQRSNEAKLNEAFDSVENVMLIFSVNRTRHFQGCAKMTSRIGGFVGRGNWKHEHGTAHYGRNFSVKWLKLCELSFHKTRHLRNPYNENLPVKISRDCQELEPSVGEELASLLYLEPDSELMAIALEAGSKRGEEKAKGVGLNNAAENPDIVPFEDNEDEEEEEESDDEEESFGAGSQGRGQGQGMMWPPQIPLARGARPMPGMRGFPAGVMSANGFSHGPMGPNGFGMPDLFGVPPRPFGLYGPNPMPGMMFPGRPPQPGPMYPPGGAGMIMGLGRGPLTGGLGGGAGRSAGMSPMLSQPPQAIRATKRDQRTLPNDWSDRHSSGSDQVRGPDGGPRNEMLHQQEGSRSSDQKEGSRSSQEDRFGAGRKFGNEESDSEDEAPRRSRHGEGKKKRRDSERDAAFSDL